MAAPTITVLCATKGRRCLELMVRSHRKAAVPGDRLIILGDGWEEPWVHGLTGDGVEFRWKPKARIGICGHYHLWKAMQEGVPGQYLALMGDDDMWTVGAFDRVRHMLDRKSIVWYPTTRGTWVAGGARAFFPNAPPFPKFGPRHRSDGEFYAALGARYGARRTHDILMVGRSVFLSPDEWVAMGLDLITPWEPWFATTRSLFDEGRDENLRAEGGEGE